MSNSPVVVLSASEFRKKISPMVIGAAYQCKAVEISLHGKLAAVLVPPALIDLCRKLSENPDDPAAQNEIIVQIVQLMRRMYE